MVKVGDKVTFVDERGVSLSATVTQVYNEGKGKQPILNLSYVKNGKTLTMHSVMHQSVRPTQADGSQILHWH